MGVDSPHIKIFFIRVTRPKTKNGRLGGTTPVRGQTPKVPRPQKNLNASYLSYVFGIFFKFSDIEMDLSIYELSRSYTTPQTREDIGDENKNFSLWGAWPPILTPYPRFYWPIL